MIEGNRPNTDGYMQTQMETSLAIHLNKNKKKNIEQKGTLCEM